MKAKIAIIAVVATLAVAAVVVHVTGFCPMHSCARAATK